MPETNAENIGELRGALNALVGEHTRNWAQVYTILQDHISDEKATFQRIEARLAEIGSWKSEMTGGMKVAGAIWKLWAGIVSLILAYLSYAKGTSR